MLAGRAQCDTFFEDLLEFGVLRLSVFCRGGARNAENQIGLGRLVDPDGNGDRSRSELVFLGCDFVRPAGQANLDVLALLIRLRLEAAASPAVHFDRYLCVSDRLPFVVVDDTFDHAG